MKKILGLAFAAMMFTGCAHTVIDGVYSDPPDSNCFFVRSSWPHHGEACWCLLEGQSDTGADVVVLAKVDDKFCPGQSVRQNGI